MRIKKTTFGIVALFLGAFLAQQVEAAHRVTVDHFARAETHRTMQDYVDLGGFGKFYHTRLPSPLDRQSVVRLNLDTLYSFGVFDLSSPVKITLPDSGNRFMSALIISEEHSMLPVVYAPTTFTVTQEQMGTRYVIIALRTFMDSTDPADIAIANKLQDQVTVSQADTGSFNVPEWDMTSLLRVRNALAVLASTVSDTKGWNYVARTYRPRPEIVSGEWVFPEMQPSE